MTPKNETPSPATSWRAIYERMFKYGTSSFNDKELETIRAGIEEAVDLLRAAATRSALASPDHAGKEG